MGDVRPLTNQEILSTIYSEFLLKEKQKCVGMVTSGQVTDQACMYRDGDGNRCFIGYFIPDHEYSPQLENKMLSRKRERYSFFKLAPETKAKLDDGTESRMAFLSTLQKIHDRTHMLDWYDQLCMLADKYGLEMKPLR